MWIVRDEHDYVIIETETKELAENLAQKFKYEDRIDGLFTSKYKVEEQKSEQ